MTTTLPRPTRPAPLLWTAIGMWGIAQLLMGGLAVGLAQRVDPWRDPVSDYALQRWGRAPFLIAVALVLAGGIALAVAARLAGLPRSRGVIVLFGLWGAGLLVVVLFRENPSTTVVTLHGEIHRFGGAVLFGCFPFAGRSLARSLSADPRWSAHAGRLRWCAALALYTAASFGLAQFVPALPEGLLERLALTAELGMLVTTALAVRTATR
ncbi:DUF998 domain-containing protein [Amycolatopsis sp. NBC_01480]|uniref:DUF998 domain-containing protein n=1 Tax=Amycolatopsis sp. NBC_01480 TaxID=2903562 RepID=UPI002E2B4557|nr:DUF998 domain-containing protein [Amycolatopsis sp. NBC_01480]